MKRLLKVFATILKLNLSNHLEAIRSERLEYKKNGDSAKLQPERYCSIILDGAGQPAVGLPHFKVCIKEERGHLLKMKLIGLLEHGVLNQLSPFAMTEEIETRANHVIETIHRSVIHEADQQVLPPTLYVQLDNCSRENKNLFMFLYLESHVAWSVFEEVIVSFLLVGHTDEDIDQTFSRTSNILCLFDSITLQDLPSALRAAYIKNTKVDHLHNVANCSGLCEKEACLRSVKSGSTIKPGTFELLRTTLLTTKKVDPGTILLLVTNGFVRSNFFSYWKPLPVAGSRNAHGFLKTLPQLENILDINVSAPPGNRLFTKRLESVEGKVKSLGKMNALYELRDAVYSHKCVSFHWNLKTIVETTQFRKDPNVSPHESAVPLYLAHSSWDSPNCLPHYHYEVGSFVAVRTDYKNEIEPFWLRKVLKLFENNGSEHILVHWYEPCSVNGVYWSKYVPTFVKKTSHNKNSWCDQISTLTIIIEFALLMKVKILPVSVQKKLEIGTIIQP